MAGMFRVQPAGLTLASGRLSTLSEDVSRVDVKGPLEGPAESLTGSDVATGAGELVCTRTTVMDQLTVALAAMGDAAEASAANYLTADGQIRSGLSAISADPSAAASP